MLNSMEHSAWGSRSLSALCSLPFALCLQYPLHSTGYIRGDVIRIGQALRPDISGVILSKTGSHQNGPCARPLGKLDVAPFVSHHERIPEIDGKVPGRPLQEAGP